MTSHTQRPLLTIFGQIPAPLPETKDVGFEAHVREEPADGIGPVVGGFDGEGAGAVALQLGDT